MAIGLSSPGCFADALRRSSSQQAGAPVNDFTNNSDQQCTNGNTGQQSEDKRIEKPLAKVGTIHNRYTGQNTRYGSNDGIPRSVGNFNTGIAMPAIGG